MSRRYAHFTIATLFIMMTVLAGCGLMAESEGQVLSTRDTVDPKSMIAPVNEAGSGETDLPHTEPSPSIIMSSPGSPAGGPGHAQNWKSGGLMGLLPGDAKAKLIQLHDEPLRQHPMNSDRLTLSVYQYEGFSVGLNERNKVVFIHVHADIKTMLPGGVRVGVRAADVMAALGEPIRNSGVVITYTLQDSVLKFDLDPQEQTVRSIKLFPA